MPVNYGFRKRTAITLQVLHPLPGSMSGPGKKGTCFSVTEIEMQQCIVPYRIQTDGEKRHINGIHSHEIQFFLPAFPIPPGSSVADSTVIHVYAITPVDNTAFPFARLRQFLRKVQLIAKPGNMCLTGILQIPIESSGQSNRSITTQNDFFTVSVYFINIDAIIRCNDLQPVLGRIAGSNPFDKLIDCFRIFICTISR